MIRTVVQYVDSSIFGGSEQVLLQLLAGLDRGRWRPVLLHHPEPGLARLVDGARSAGVQVDSVPRVTDRNFPIRLPQLVSAIATQRPAVVHAQLNWPLACKFGLLAATLGRVPAVVATVHLVIEELLNGSVRLQGRIFGVGVHRYLAVSEHVRGRLAAGMGWPEQKLRVVPNGIDPAPFSQPFDPALRQWLTRGSQRPLVFTAARLSPEKAIDVLVSAAARVPEAVFAIAGDGPERAAIRMQVEALGISERVRLLGARSDIPALLAACDLFVLPSLVEGLPISVLEAMAAARPVVATRIGGTDEVVMDGRTGLLVPPQDPEPLAAAIRSFLADPERGRQAGKAGREQLLARFTSKVMIDAVSATYEELLAR
ncbi:MAG TPA: glycosyltransferase [Gemmatimonadales bacterium]|jgi:glycosyltransferase involved in cell wall biosynthesis|nr:glycosyltransferase [Gemmatimonadales bacterium]